MSVAPIPGLTLSFRAAAAVAARRLVKLSATGEALQAAAAADVSFGVSERVGAAAGGVLDVVTSGVAEVEFGAAALTAGVLVTADADGKAVAAAVGARAVGFALEAIPAGGGFGRVLILPQKA